MKNLELKDERLHRLKDVFTKRIEKKVTVSQHKEALQATKGGVVCRGQTTVVKSNYEIAGKKRPDGSRPTKKEIGIHASASLNYMNNHGNDDIKDENTLSNIYDDNAERIKQDEFNRFRMHLESKGLNASRRTMVSTGQQISRENYVNLVKESVETFKDLTDKNFEYKFAIHTDHELPHAHIFMYANNSRDILMNKEQIQLLKEIVADKTETLLASLEKGIDKEHIISKEVKIDGGFWLWKHILSL